MHLDIISPIQPKSYGEKSSVHLTKRAQQTGIGSSGKANNRFFKENLFSLTAQAS